MKIQNPRLRSGRALRETRERQLRIGDGDYYEGVEEGIAIGRKRAIEQATEMAYRPAGNRHMDFVVRQQIIVGRIAGLA